MRQDDGPVIGLEIHIQLRTQTKLFCSCPVDPAAEPNTSTCPVCLGHPGTLPVLNEEAVLYGVRLGLALESEIGLRTRFYRKNYFYPDLAKGYQITQHTSCIAKGGFLRFFHEGRERALRITGVALEEEAAKSVYTEDGFALLDFNRAGVPLLEVVTEPDLRSGPEARAALEALRLVVRYLGISEGDMEKGHLRVDTNVSYVLNGVQGERVEIKNINTFKAVQDAILAEAERQRRVMEEGGRVLKETRNWDEYLGETVAMRLKEEASDYRFFPEPDLLPLVLSEEFVEGVRSRLTELPLSRQKRYVAEHGLPGQVARVITSSRELADYYEAVASGLKDKPRAGNFVATEVLGALRERKERPSEFPVGPEALRELLGEVEAGRLSLPGAKAAFFKALERGVSPMEVVQEEGLVGSFDPHEMAGMIREILREHPDEVARFKAGKKGLLGFFVGEVMKRSRGKADPKAAARVISEEIEKT